MSTVRTLVDVKTQYGEKVIETGTSFVVNRYGKYRPNISFVLAKDFSGDPLKHRSDAPTREMIAGLGLGFGASESDVSVLFGDFWLSKANKPHFRPQSPQTATHIVIRAGWGGGAGCSGTRGRWDAPEGAAYFRRASSNGGGTGYDYYVLPVGYYLVVHDEELDGDAVVAPDFAARALQVRAAFEQYDRQQTDAAIAKAQEKTAAEADSRIARTVFLPRLEALQVRLTALRMNNPSVAYGDLTLGEVYFVLGWGDKLYTEANVTEAESNVTYWEGQSVKRQQRAAMTPRFEVLAPRLAALGSSLRFCDDQVTWVGNCYGSFPYDEAGLAACEAAIVRQEEVAAENVRKEAAAAAKLKAEAEAKALGMLSNVSIWRRMGGVTNRGNGWVVRPDGSQRDADCNPSQGNLVWNQILPGELVLRYRQSDRYDIAHCEVVHRPELVTPEQLAVVKQIEEEMGASKNAFGLDDRLSALLNRRKEAIRAAMTELPAALQPSAWEDYQVLVSENGISLDVSSAGWVNYTAPFDTSCEGRSAQVVFSHPAADGVLQVVAYDKWGGMNFNLRWRKDATVTEVTTAPHTEEKLDMATAMERLRTKYGK